MNDQALFELVRDADPLGTAVGEPPRALLERVLESPRGRTPRLPRWQAKVALTAVVLALSGAIAALAIAGTGWLTGEPAPPQVVTNFRDYTPQLGFHPDPGKAVLVAQQGHVELYATTNREGTYCLDLVAPWKPATVDDGGTCVPSWIASGHFVAGNLSSTRTTVVVGGRIADARARSVQFTGPHGTPVTVPVGSSGFFLATLKTSEPCAGNWSSTFTALDAGGEALAQTGKISLVRVSETDSRRGGPVRACWFGFLQK
jgi:hypothetical protein